MGAIPWYCAIKKIIDHSFSKLSTCSSDAKFSDPLFVYALATFGQAPGPLFFALS
jgi:hypothetical protein